MSLGLRHNDPSISIGNTSVSPSITQRSRRSSLPRFIGASAWSDVDNGKGAPFGVRGKAWLEAVFSCPMEKAT